MAHLGGGDPTGYYEMEDEPADVPAAEAPAPQAAPRTLPRRRHAVPLTTILAYLTLFFFATLDVDLLPAVYSLVSSDIPVPDGGELVARHRLEVGRLAVGAGAAVLAGVLVDCQPRHFAFATAVVAGKAAAVALHFATDFTQLQVGHALTGVTAGALIPLMGSLLSDLFPVGSRVQMVGFVLTALTAGPLAGRHLGLWLGQLYGWRLAVLVLAVPGIAAALLALFLPEPLRATQEEALGLDSRSGALWAYRRRLSVAKLAGVFSPPTFLLLLGQAVVVGPAACALDVLPLYLSADLRLPAASATGIDDVWHLAGLLGLCLGGVVAQEVYHVSRSGLAVIAAASLLLTSGLSVLLFQPALMTDVQVLVVLAGLAGALACVALPCTASMALGVNRPETRGVALGLLVAAQAAGLLMGPPLVSVLIAQFGGDRPRALLVASLGWAVGTALLALAASTFRSDEAALQAAMAQVFELELEMQEMLAPGSTDNYDPAAQSRWPFGRGAYEDALAADIAAAGQAEFAAYGQPPPTEVPRSGSQSSIVELGEYSKCAIPRTHSW